MYFVEIGSLYVLSKNTIIQYSVSDEYNTYEEVNPLLSQTVKRFQIESMNASDV